VFWLLVILWLIIFPAHPGHFHGAEIVCFMIQDILQLAIPAYVNIYIVLPFFRKRKILIAILLFICQIVLLPLIEPPFLDLIRLLFVKLYAVHNCIDWSIENLNSKVVAYVIMATIFKYAKDNLMRSKEQKEAELRHLKSQLNPHFLFNTLNNLYGLSVVKSDNLPPLMLKLSELLRYSVYDTEQTFVPLEKEIAYLKNYVEMEKIRMNDDVIIEFNDSGDFSNQYIAPLMLIVFVENSFKHFSFTRNEQGFVQISLNIKENVFSLRTKNSLDPILYKENKKGIGLENVQKRLTMLYYNKYELKINHMPDSYEVYLKIDLSL
jgi:LytS/YehU family sensor histidine kinase